MSSGLRLARVYFIIHPFKKEVKKFLYSEWFEELTNASGKYIYKILKDEEKKGELYEGQLNSYYTESN